MWPPLNVLPLAGALCEVCSPAVYGFCPDRNRLRQTTTYKLAHQYVSEGMLTRLSTSAGVRLAHRLTSLNGSSANLSILPLIECHADRPL